MVKIIASSWYTAQIMLYKSQLNPAADSGKPPISKDEYLMKVGKLMTLPILREKAPDWLHVAVEHLSKPDPADDQRRSVMKKVVLCSCRFDLLPCPVV